MKKIFVIACIIAFVVQYEDLNHFIVMLVVGDFDASQAWANAFRHSSIESAFSAGFFRLIPFALLVLVTMCTNLSTNFRGKATLLMGFVVTNIVIFLGYWSVTESLYTDAHASSTSAINYFWAPIMATLFASIACTVTYFSIWFSELVLKRA